MKRILIFMLCLLSSAVIYAQQRTITGLVTDLSDNTPLSGASVYAVGTDSGTITSDNGKFTLTVPSGTKAISIYYLGYKELRINLTNTQDYYKIGLESDATDLDDAVVIGYGVVKKSDLTGSVASLKSEDINKNNPISIEKGLQGRLTGVNVIQNDGAPGSGISVQIRGTNSFLGGTEPLYVIDNIPMTSSNDQESVNFESGTYSYRNALSFLDPNDIESIEVLKDASATAIYGSRGANGVIMITTKSGAGIGVKNRVSVNYNYTLSQPARKIRMLGAQEYAMYRNESAINTAIYNGRDFKQSELPFPGTRIEMSGHVKGPDEFPNDPYYWQNQIFQNANTHNASINVSGSSKTMDYSLSGSLLDQEGTVKNSDYKRYTFKINFNNQVKPWLKIGTSTNISYALSNMLKTTISAAANGTEGVIRSALMYPPTYTTDDSVAKDNEFSTVTTPHLYTQALNSLKNVKIYTSNYANINITKHLIFRTVFGFSYSTNTANQYWPVYLYEGRNIDGKSYAGDKTWSYLVWDNLLMYNRTFGKHSVSATLGTSWDESHWYNKQISVQGFGTDLTNGWLLQDAAVINTPHSSKGDSKMFSVIMRAAYHYDHRYYITFTGRSDSSSKFTKGNRTAFFPSVGVSWRLSQEKFMEPIKDVLSNVKFRYSYGTSGNQAISSYQTFAMMASANYPFGDSVINGYSPDQWNPGNPSLKWETTYQHDAGLELSLFNKIDLTIDYYHKHTKDLLQYKEMATSTGLARILSNAGGVINTGWEFAIKADIFNRKNFSWTVGANLSLNRNYMTDFGDKPMFPNEIWSSWRPFALQDGHPIGSLYGFVEEGIWSSRDEVINSKQFQSQYPGYTVDSNDETTEIIIKRKWIGEIKYKDFNDDGSITEDDQTFIGDTNPNFFYGINMDFKFYGFDLSILFQGVQGNDILNMNLFRFYDIGNPKNIPLEIYKQAWTQESGGTAPKNFYDNGRVQRFSRRYIEDGSYLKLRNISIGYTLNKPFKGLESARIYASANNVFTITKYSGYDPEVNSFGSDPSLRGVDSGGYPQPRSFVFGVNLTF